MLFKLSFNEVLLEKETLYHHMAILEGVDPFHGGKVRTMVLDDHLHSAMDLNDPQRIIYNYNNYFHMGFVFNPNITTVLFIGGGGFSGPKRFLADYPKVQVDVVEIDYDVIAAAKQYFDVRNDPRLRIFNEDGRLYLVGSEKKYDLVVLDAYSRTYVPFHLMTMEFFRELSRDLTPNGVIVSNLISSLTGPSSELLKAECNTVRQVFNNIYPTHQTAGGGFPPLQQLYLPEGRLVEYPKAGTLSIGFLTSEVSLKGTAQAQRLVSVYLPTNNLYLGNVALFKQEDLIVTDFTVEEG
jgi:spermidine synthase